MRKGNKMQKYSQIYKLGFKKAYQYRANFLIGLVSVIFPLIIQYFLWSGLFNSSAENTVFGYTFSQMISYVFFASLTTKIITTTFVYEINTDIKEGGFAKYLVKPISYFNYNLFSYLGEKSGIMISSSVLIIAIWFILNNPTSQAINIANLILFFIAMSIGLILNFVIFFGICSMSFWMIDASGAIFITTLVGTIVSGGIFPLDIFNEKVQFILHLLPFPYTSYFPVSILCGMIQQADLFQGFAMQIFWIIVCSAIAKIAWSIGTKKFVSIGG